MVFGSRMSQDRIRLVSSEKGSSTAVVGSGMSTMSDSLMPFQPAIDEPSNIFPSVNMSSSTMLAGIDTCCSLPRVSVKRRSTNLTSLSFINFRTSFAADMAWTSPGFGCD